MADGFQWTGCAAAERALSVGQWGLASTRTSAPTYLAALEQALEDEPPPYGTLVYAEMVGAAATSPQWLAVRSLVDVERATGAASHARVLAARTPARQVRAALHQHALRYAQLARQSLALLDLCLPEMVAPELLAQLDELCPAGDEELSDDEIEDGTPTLAELAILNAGALRTAALRLLVAPFPVQHCPDHRVEAAEAQSKDLLEQSAHLVADSARLLEGRRATTVVLTRILRRSLALTTRAHAEETIDYSYHVRFGTYP